MKTAIFVLLVVASVLVAGDDHKRDTDTSHDANEHENNGQQHPAPLRQQQSSQDGHRQDGAWSQQHQQSSQQPGDQHRQDSTRLSQQQQQPSQPHPYQQHKRDSPVRDGLSTAAPKDTVDPKQPSPLPAIISQAPKYKRDTVTAQPGAGPTNDAPTKEVTGSNPQRKNPTSGTRLSREQPKVHQQAAQSHAKVPAAASAQPAANPAKKL